LLFRQCYPVIRARCARILGDSQEAEDVAQETFLRFCRAGSLEATPEARLAWLYKTSTHLAIDVWRRRRAGVEVAAPSGPPVAAAIAAADAVVGARRSLELVRQRLPARELEVAVLSRIDGLSYPEIARVTGRSERTVRRLLERVQDRLARLEKEVLA
jgi:RNA polymerase sigma-70 factor (ECF subfamily)